MLVGQSPFNMHQRKPDFNVSRARGENKLFILRTANHEGGHDGCLVGDILFAHYMGSIVVKNLLSLAKICKIQIYFKNPESNENTHVGKWFHLC